MKSESVKPGNNKQPYQQFVYTASASAHEQAIVVGPQFVLQNETKVSEVEDKKPSLKDIVKKYLEGKSKLSSLTEEQSKEISEVNEIINESLKPALILLVNSNFQDFSELEKVIRGSDDQEIEEAIQLLKTNVKKAVESKISPNNILKNIINVLNDYVLSGCDSCLVNTYKSYITRADLKNSITNLAVGLVVEQQIYTVLGNSILATFYSQISEGPIGMSYFDSSGNILINLDQVKKGANSTRNITAQPQSDYYKNLFELSKIVKKHDKDLHFYYALILTLAEELEHCLEDERTRKTVIEKYDKPTLKIFDQVYLDLHLKDGALRNIIHNVPGKNIQQALALSYTPATHEEKELALVDTIKELSGGIVPATIHGIPPEISLAKWVERLGIKEMPAHCLSGDLAIRLWAEALEITKDAITPENFAQIDFDKTSQLALDIIDSSNSVKARQSLHRRYCKEFKQPLDESANFFKQIKL